MSNANEHGGEGIPLAVFGPDVGFGRDDADAGAGAGDADAGAGDAAADAGDAAADAGHAAEAGADAIQLKSQILHSTGAAVPFMRTTNNCSPTRHSTWLNPTTAERSSSRWQEEG